jgi:transcriptional regulator with XRE-family HTH domain
MARKSLLYKMPDRLSVREKIGAGQKHYASFCGISKSMLSMIEINQRDWPSKKSDMEIRHAFYEAEKQNPDISAFEKPDDYQKKANKMRLMKLKIECYKLESALESMTFIYQQAARMLKTCAILHQKFTEPKALEFKIIDFWEFDASLKLSKNNPVDQELMQIQLECVKRQMEVLERNILIT